jgi:acyl-CoA reductase-like NAD-dependent aldehyde dehydrogenase
MWIGGTDAEALSGRTFEVRDPATGSLVGRLPRGDGDDVRAAVDMAESALPLWSVRTYRERGRVLERAAEIIRGRAGSLAEQLTLEQGKPLREAVDEIRGVANVFEFYAGLSSSVADQSRRISGGLDAAVLRRPIGVTGAIIPWNMPALIFGWKTGAALLAGNSLVLKPASTAPMTPLALARILGEAGLPPGALNLVTGPGEEVGEALVVEPRIRKISFTGAPETGRRIYALAAGGVKRLALELGGSDPMIVCADAGLDRAAAGAAAHRFYNCGQICTSVKRLYVHEAVAPAFLTRLASAVGAIRLGRGTEPGVGMGPLNSSAGRDRIAELVDETVEREEGHVLAGGRAPGEPALSAGAFYEPTVITDVARESRLLREEVFGPVLPVATFATLDEAIALANDTPFGLGASVWTRDPAAARTAIERLEAGIVWVNLHLKVPPEVPFGGVKQSGLGRENGIQAVDAWSETKSVLIGR